MWLSLPIDDAEEVVEQGEDDELSVEQLVDASLPSQQQVEERPQPCVCDPAGVRHRHGCLAAA